MFKISDDIDLINRPDVQFKDQKKTAKKLTKN